MAGRRRGIAALLVAIGIVVALGVIVFRPDQRRAASDEPTAVPSATGPVASLAPSPSDRPVSGAPTPPATPTSSPTGPTASPIPSREIAIRAFLDDLTSAIRSGDTAAMLAGLHPQVIRRYGEAACDAELASRAPDPGYTIDVVEIGPPERWAFESDGESRRIADAVTVIARVTAGGMAEEREIHVATADGAVRWFTDCGEPID